MQSCRCRKRLSARCPMKTEIPSTIISSQATSSRLTAVVHGVGFSVPTALKWGVGNSPTANGCGRKDWHITFDIMVLSCPKNLSRSQFRARGRRSKMIVTLPSISGSNGQRNGGLARFERELRALLNQRVRRNRAWLNGKLPKFFCVKKKEQRHAFSPDALAGP